jgi:ABC-type multidrug transport system fused ATPase/permease subunit
LQSAKAKLQIELAEQMQKTKFIIEAENISYNFPGKKLFDNFTFKVKKGEKIAIIGETGSGKSTLLDIILGLLEPSKGEVVVNSASLLSSLDLSRFYSYVPQQPFLIDGTIFQNIIFGKEERLDIQRDDNIISALEKSCCKEFVDKLEDGLEATVGENGIKLSLGQRQRLSLARALYRNSKLLVMDEPTSALDPKIEEEVILNLCKYFKDWHAFIGCCFLSILA